MTTNEQGQDFPTFFACINSVLVNEIGDLPVTEPVAKKWFEKGWFARPAAARIWAKRKGLR